MTNRTILLVEDNQDLREVAAELLAEEGFGVHLAATGQEVIALLLSGFRPDCILLDLGLPDMTSADFLESFTRIPGAAEIPVVLVSGNAEIGNWATRFRASRIVRKPYGIDTLLTAAAELCGNRRELLSVNR
jgi:CheY-like chemotaxis protein